MTSFRRLAAAGAVLAAMLPAAAPAADVTDLLHIAVLDGWQTDTGSHMAALRITLEDGWKTYWRMPGDSGIPPQFSWSGSDNLGAVQIHWPRPTVFDDGGVETIGYKGEFVLPVEVFPRDANAPIRLEGSASVGVCREVCVPVDQVFGGLLSATTAALPGDRVAIREALADRPDRVSGPKTVTCSVDPIADGLRPTVRIDVPDQGGRERVVFETGRPDLWISPTQSSRDGHILVASAELVPPEARPFAFDRSELRVTVLGATRAVEMRGCRGA